jgi:hypothetical protein
MRILLPPLILLLAASPTAAATRSYTITSFTKIRVNGPYLVTLTTNNAPFARATGDAKGLDAVSMSVEGTTLIIRPDRSAWGGYPGQARQPVQIFVGTHELSSAWVYGAGSIVIDRVKGLRFDLAVEGSGSAEIAQAAVDRLGVTVSGTGSAKVSGNALRLDAEVRGSSLLDAAQLTSRDANLAADGPSQLKAFVTSTAKINAVGAADIQIAGKPACTSRIYGSASVAGCK